MELQRESGRGGNDRVADFLLADGGEVVMNWVLMITWLAQGSPVYKSMGGGQTIAYISDIGVILSYFFLV